MKIQRDPGAGRLATPDFKTCYNVSAVSFASKWYWYKDQIDR